MNVLIVDDHPLVCSGIRNILISEENIANVMQANDIKTAMELMSTHSFHLALVDMRLKNETGVDFIENAKSRYPECKFVVLSSSSTAKDFEKAIKAGVDGYILKDAFPEDIIYAVNTVLRGRKYFDPVFMEKKTDPDPGQPLKSPHELLSPREMEVLFCLGAGLSNKKIADKLFISENTVKKHVSQILAKLNLADRTQAALYASKIKNNNN
jgi:two-component system nitrate/nitrite response regulator NarL